MPVIELLSIDECPHRDSTKRLIMEVLQEEDVEVTLREVRIHTTEDAVRHRFFGSPTVRINGEDIEPQHVDHGYSIACRMYPHDGGFSGVPPKALIQAAVRSVK